MSNSGTINVLDVYDSLSDKEKEEVNRYKEHEDPEKPVNWWLDFDIAITKARRETKAVYVPAGLYKIQNAIKIDYVKDLPEEGPPPKCGDSGIGFYGYRNFFSYVMVFINVKKRKKERSF